MTTAPIPDDDAVDDEAYAQDMRDYWVWAASQPDPDEYHSNLAAQRHPERMEEEGIAAAEQALGIDATDG